MTPRERALDRMLAFTPHLPSPGQVVEELIACYSVAEVARDLLTERRLGASVSWEKLEEAIAVLDTRKP